MGVALFFKCAVVSTGVFLFGVWGSDAAEQRITLQAGWNSVFVELEPDESDPELIFAGLPVEKCSLFLPSTGKVTSLTDPAAVPRKTTEWHTWQPASSPSAFLNNLHAIPARSALLIKASAAAELVITGEPVFRRQKWTGTSFNFTGFEVDPAAPPTFARFFDGSTAHDGLKVFRLSAGGWQKVAATDAIERGEAYWVWCRKGSDFQGPVDLTLPTKGSGGLTMPAGGRSIIGSARGMGSLPVTLVIDGEDSGVTSSSASLDLSGGARREFALRASGGVGDGSVTVSGGGMKFIVPLRSAL